MTYRLVHTYKILRLSEESLFEMSAVNNFGIWNRYINHSITPSKTLEEILYRKLIKAEWISEE